MCLIAFAIEAHPSVPLLLAGNRDEFFERPTDPLHRWALPNGVEVLAGRDLRDGGTWLGTNTQGRVAMLTNVRSPATAPTPRSRGELANRWLSGEMDWATLLASLEPSDYGGFNLVVGDALNGVWGWVTNRNPAAPHAPQSPTLHSQRLGPGVYGLSNAVLDTDWPKTLRLKAALVDALQMEDPALAQAHLLQALGHAQPAPTSTLPQTGVPVAWEQTLSSPFVHSPAKAYGTRSSLVVRATRHAQSPWRVTMDEWTHSADAQLPVAWPSTPHRSAELSW